MSEALHIHVLQHVPFEGIGALHDWVATRGHALRVTRLFAGDPLPAPRDIDWLIVMGGPMGVHDDEHYPWLAGETAFIRDCVSAGRTVLGICLGGQLIAHALGAAVTRNREREIGWFPVKPVSHAVSHPLVAGLPRELHAFHWHGETFALPDGATRLYESDACTHQAFAYGNRVLALQFHLEVTPENADALIENCPSDLVAGPYVQDAEAMMEDSALFAAANAAMTTLMNTLEETTRGATTVPA